MKMDRRVVMMKNEDLHTKKIDQGSSSALGCQPGDQELRRIHCLLPFSQGTTAPKASSPGNPIITEVIAWQK